MKIKLLSNMYPSVQDPLFGVFVNKTVLALSGLGATFTQKIVIRGKRNSSFQKILTYSRYYLKAMGSVFHRQNELIYVHFLTHNLPLIYWYNIFQNKPIIVNLHGSDINKIKKGSKLDLLQNRALKKVTQIIVPSVYFKGTLQQRYPELSSPIFIYPSGGIDIKTFKPKNNIEKQLCISFVSRIDHGKGWEDFLTIIKTLNDDGIKVKAIIAGDGAEKNKLLNAIENHPYKNQIDYRGFQSKEKLAQIYQSSELFIFPTQLAESLGLVGLEAMACKTVVFARNIGGPTGYIQSGENGFLFNSKIEAIQQIKNYLALPTENKCAIQQEALATAQEYNTDKVATNLYANFKNLCTTS